ncbi:hypothetical protein [Sphingobacterium griseoflavum]|nr:hypothetical protein [Sphingobacterium griseoflavum]
MSAYKFKKEDFEELEGVFVFAVASDLTGSVAVYELTDPENIIYEEIAIIESTILAGVLTLLAKRPFDGQAVVTNDALMADLFHSDTVEQKDIVRISEGTPGQ